MSCIPLLAALSLGFAAWVDTPASASEDASCHATVVEVIDGDTIRVRIRGDIATVRMIGIDAPERGHPARPKEFAADEAADALSAMCRGKRVLLEKDIEEVDRHGRLLRYVFSDDRTLFHNRELVRLGLARVYRRFPFTRLAEFEEAEAGAKRDGLGVWHDRGLDELRWARSRGGEPVSVWQLGGRSYGIALAGMGKAGLGADELQGGIAMLTRLKAELSDAEFAVEARKAGFGAIDTPGGAREADETAGRRTETAPPAARDASAADGVVPWEQAAGHMGATVTVEGTVVRAKRSGNVVFLNFHANWKRYLTVVLFPPRLPGLPADPEAFYRGRRIRVRGEIKRYKGRPEIVVESAGDIRIVP